MSSLRKLISGNELIVAPVALNPIMARLAEAAGFKAVKQSYECLAQGKLDPFLGRGGAEKEMKAAQETCDFPRFLDIERRTMKG